jgi:tetratricopeptide (TPR) repeat protein
LLERYDEAINLLEDNKKSRGFRGIAPYSNLGALYIAKREYEKARIVYSELLNNFPDNAPSYQYLATLYLFWNKLDDAMEAYEKADTVLPGYPHAQLGRWWVSLLEEDWERAAAEASALTESNDERWYWQGQFNQAILELYKGQTQNALPLLNHAAELFHEPGLLSGWAHSMAGHMLFENHQFSDSLNQSRLAQQHGKGNPPEWEGLFLEALTLAKQGRVEEASKTAAELLERTEPIPTQKEKRRHLHLTGELALIQNQSTTAIEKLEQAESMLPPRGRHGYIHWSRIGPPSHVPIWYSLASAYLAAGDDEKAAESFRRIIDCGVERVEWPIYYVRSFYFLGKIHENRGDTEKAREHYQRFVDFWKDGDIDRERVEEALNKIR